ncbi:MAG: serine hydrolase [Anaerolineae bacterium]|nr:serine hydrolase [Anaerolineae bacterium]
MESKKSEINRIFSNTLSEWQIPGGALAVVADGQSYAQGFGLRAAGQPEPVDADTVFAIGSTSKAFTSAAVGLLVDDGKLAWDDPVLKYLPDFQLYDAWVTQNITIRDLLCHRLGLERAQRLYYRGYQQAEIIRRMRYLQPVAGFRTGFHYANQQFGTAGLIIEAAGGLSWDDFVTERIFKPLGMGRSASGFDRLSVSSNLSAPHASLDETYPAGVRFLGEKAALPWYQLSHEPAGSILTCANDLTAWLKVLVNGGAPLLKPATFAEIGTPQMIMQDLQNSELAPLYFLQPDTRFWTYGLGWWVMDYRGEKVLMHGGQMPGFNSVVAFYPERGIALAVLLNVHQTLAHAALFYALSDILLNASGRDWSTEFKQVAQGYMAQVKAAVDATAAARKKEISPSVSLQALTGVYENELYGDLELTLQDGFLTLQYGDISAILEHWQENTFLARWNLKGLLEDSLVSFQPENQKLILVNDRAEYRKII